MGTTCGVGGAQQCPLWGRGWGPHRTLCRGRGRKTRLGNVPGDPPTPCLFPPGDLGTSVGTGGKERAGVRLWGRARPRLFAQPKLTVASAFTRMRTRGRRCRILPRKRPNRPRWTSTGCGERGEGRVSAGPQIGDPKSGSPNVGPQMWEPKSGSPNPGAQIWEPKSGIPNVVPQMGTPTLGAHIWNPKCGTTNVGPQIWNPKSVSPNLGAQIRDPKCGTPNLEPQISEPKSGIPNVGSQIWNPKSGIPNVGPHIWDPKSGSPNLSPARAQDPPSVPPRMVLWGRGTSSPKILGTGPPRVHGEGAGLSPHPIPTHGCPRDPPPKNSHRRRRRSSAGRCRGCPAGTSPAPSTP